MGTPAVLKLYRNLEGVFSEEKANELPVSGPYDHEIKLKGDCQPPYGLIYPLSTPELHVLREYLHDNLAKGFCEADGVTIVVRTVWLREERELSLCRPVAGTIGSAVRPKR